MKGLGRNTQACNVHARTRREISDLFACLKYVLKEITYAIVVSEYCIVN